MTGIVSGVFVSQTHCQWQIHVIHWYSFWFIYADHINHKISRRDMRFLTSSEWQVLYGFTGWEMDGGAVHFPSPRLHTKLSFRWRNDWGISSIIFLFHNYYESRAKCFTSHCQFLTILKEFEWSLAMIKIWWLDPLKKTNKYRHCEPTQSRRSNL